MNEGGLNPSTVFKSFHYQAGFAVSDRGLIVRFLMLWLKICIILSLPKDAIAISVVYLAVFLTYGRPFGLLPAMVNNFQSGLRAVSKGFIPEDKTKGKTAKGSTKESTEVKTPNPRMEMPFTYMMVWLVIDCPSLMTTANYCPIDKPFFEETYECSSSKSHFMLMIHKTLQYHQNYKIKHCFFDFPDGGYRSRFKDVLGLDNFSTLSSGVFWWLLSIHPGHLI